MSIPPRAYPAVPLEPLASKPVLETINYIAQRDERISGPGGSLSSCEVLQRHLGTAHVGQGVQRSPPTGARPSGPTSYAEPRREAHR